MFEIAIKWRDMFDVRWWLDYRNVAMVAFAIVLGTTGLGLFATKPLVALAVGLGAAMVAIGVWWVLRELYWRSGSGQRVALCVEGLRVPTADLRQTELLFKDAVRAGQLKRLVTVRPIPLRMCASQTRIDRASARYRFDAVCILKVARGDSKNRAGKMQIAMSVKHQEQVNQALMESAKLPLAQVFALGALPSPFDVASFRCDKLFDMMLFILGTAAVNDKSFWDAFALLDLLDRRLEQKQSSPTTAPRINIRTMAIQCLLRPVTRPAGDWIDGELEEAKTRARVGAARYAEQFPGLCLTLARVLVLAGETAEAQRLCRQIEKAVKDEPIRTLAVLGCGVTALLQDRYDEAHAALERFCASESLNAINWADLIEFAETMQARGVMSAVFLRAFYQRYAAGGVAPVDLENEVMSWFEKDSRRGRLKYLYESQRRSIESKVPQRVVAPVPKHRFKRRKKKH